MFVIPNKPGREWRLSDLIRKSLIAPRPKRTEMRRKKGRHSEADRVKCLEMLDAGIAPVEVSRRMGIHPKTVSTWRERRDAREAAREFFDGLAT